MFSVAVSSGEVTICVQNMNPCRYWLWHPGITISWVAGLYSADILVKRLEKKHKCVQGEEEQQQHNNNNENKTRIDLTVRGDIHALSRMQKSQKKRTILPLVNYWLSGKNLFKILKIPACRYYWLCNIRMFFTVTVNTSR